MHILDRYDLFIFDWDGTLVTTPTFDVITKRIKPRYNMTFIKRHKRYYLRQTVENVKLEKQEAAEHSFFSSLYDIFSLFYKPKLKPSTVDILKLLKARHKKVVIFSDAKQYRLTKEVHDLGVAKYVDYLLSSESIRSFKPSPLGLEFIIRHMRSNRKKALYIGDFVSDVMMSKFGGVDVCAVADGISSYAQLKDTAPNYVFRSLKDMREHLLPSRR